MIINGVEIDGSTSAIQLFTSPIVENILNSGIISATNGSIIAQKKDTHQRILSLVMINLKSVSCDGTYQQGNNCDQNCIPERIKHCKSQDSDLLPVF